MRYLISAILFFSLAAQAKEVKTSMARVLSFPFYLSVGGRLCGPQQCKSYEVVHKVVTVDLEPMEDDPSTYYGSLSAEHEVQEKKYISRISVFLNSDQSMDFILSTHEPGVYSNFASTSMSVESGKAMNFSGHFRDFALTRDESVTTMIFVGESHAAVSKGKIKAIQQRALVRE